VGTKQAPPAHQTNRKKKLKTRSKHQQKAKNQKQKNSRNSTQGRLQLHENPSSNTQHQPMPKPPALSLKTRSGNHANILPKLPCIFISYSYRCIIKPYHTIQDARNCLNFFLDPF
jgi:hypothetical protein